MWSREREMGRVPARMWRRRRHRVRRLFLIMGARARPIKGGAAAIQEANPAALKNSMVQSSNILNLIESTTQPQQHLIIMQLLPQQPQSSTHLQRLLLNCTCPVSPRQGPKPLQDSCTSIQNPRSASCVSATAASSHRRSLSSTPVAST